MLRPVTEGLIKSVGELKFKSTNLFVADATLYDQNGKVVGRGSGSFMKTKIALSEKIGYK
jgi:acyl-coenzyme A thioesterase PaaI-like protein